MLDVTNNVFHKRDCFWAKTEQKIWDELSRQNAEMCDMKEHQDWIYLMID